MRSSNLSTPVRYGLIGLFAGSLGPALSAAISQPIETPWWLSLIAMGIGGYVGGYLKQRRDKSR